MKKRPRRPFRDFRLSGAVTQLPERDLIRRLLVAEIFYSGLNDDLKSARRHDAAVIALV